MKIAVISPNANHLQEISRALGGHMVTLVQGDQSKIRVVAEQQPPDVMLIEGMCCTSDELGQIEYVTTHYAKVAVILLCSTQTPDFLINAMRAGVREVLPSPVTPSALDAAVNRIGAKLVSAQAKNTGKILAFMPCKGGSGATFLATNLGYQLAETKTVLLIDLNLQFGDALSFVHDGKPTSTLADIARDIGRLDASFLAASSVKIAPNYSIMAAPEDPSQAIEVKPEHIDAILGLAVTQYDFILLDMNRTLDTLSIKALDRAYRIYPVLQAELAYLRNAGKLLNAFKALGYPKEKMELIVNRFEKSGEIGLDDIQRTLGSISLRTVPSSYKEVSTSINQGNPLIKMARSNAVTKKLVELMSSVSPKQEESRGFLERMFRRA
jgi:pilus assembly protein CpaE